MSSAHWLSAFAVAELDTDAFGAKARDRVEVAGPLRRERDETDGRERAEALRAAGAELP